MFLENFTGEEERSAAQRGDPRRGAARRRNERLWVKTNQDKKGIRWMPWRQEPKKDAVSCEKPRGAASRHRAVDIRMGQPGGGKRRHPRERGGTWGSETSKYPEEKKSNEIPQVAASERG